MRKATQDNGFIYYLLKDHYNPSATTKTSVDCELLADSAEREQNVLRRPPLPPARKGRKGERSDQNTTGYFGPGMKLQQLLPVGTGSL